MKIRRPDDFHVHLRDGDMLTKMAPHSNLFRSVLVMPNTTKPVLTADDACDYRFQILETGVHFLPLMTIKLTNTTTPKTIRACNGQGILAGKLYPEGVTTNSQDGVSDFTSMFPVFEAMEKADMVLCLHGETPGVFTLDREEAFLKTLLVIVRAFPKLRVVLEHVTTEAAVETVRLLPDNVAATITVHHLFLTLDDVIGGMLKPHLFCKPVAKRASDRDALIKAALSENPKFFLGTDSAPHLVGKKECASGCAGVFTAPVAMSCLAEVFENVDGSLNKLEGFTSTFGNRFYLLPESNTNIDLVEAPWTVPALYDGVVPFRAGDTLKWKVSP